MKNVLTSYEDQLQFLHRSNSVVILKIIQMSFLLAIDLPGNFINANQYQIKWLPIIFSKEKYAKNNLDISFDTQIFRVDKSNRFFFNFSNPLI